MDSQGKPPSTLGRGTLTRSRPTFLTRTATDDALQLLRRSSLPQSPEQDLIETTVEHRPYDPNTEADKPFPRRYEHTKKVLGSVYDGSNENAQKQSPRRRRIAQDTLGPDSLAARMLPDGSRNRSRSKSKGRSRPPKIGTVPRPVGGTEKLDTFSGVFVPTSLNVLSILMFIRFGFILGQSGVVGMMGMLVVAYLINLVTTMSISAVASNGTVRGGGAYYLISRSLGPEFGGSIGIVFYLGFVFNTSMNALGLIDCVNQNFGSESGNWSNFLEEGFWWQYLWASAVLFLCTAICLAGSAIFARASNGLLVLLLIATLSIPVSALFVRPFEQAGIEFTGFSGHTFKGNLLPHFTRHAAGSQSKGRETFQDLFGILFPATGGIFAGASMSGDLKNPSKSIPRGTLYGLALTFVSYTLVIFAMAATITRQSFYNNVNVIQDVNLSGILILLGEFSTTFFSALMGVIGPAKLLQAMGRDKVFPGLTIFGQGTEKGDEPTYAILFTYAIAQATMLFDINQLAGFITMTYLMTFLVTNLACFLLKLSSAPNFRPSFHYFNWWTAALGAILSGVSMFFVDGMYASGAIGVLIALFLVIHYTTPPKAWGDVSQSLIYHQVRKYLLRLRQEHVKFWRPQILLFVNDPRRGYKLIQFCNSLKKGALFILGHVIVTSDFGASVPEARRQQSAWTKFIDQSLIKAFINVAISPSIEWGTRNIILSAGLGGMRPNIIVMGFYNLKQFRQEQPLIDVPSPPPERKFSRASKRQTTIQGPRKRRKSISTKQLEGALPTDTCYVEKRTDIQSYVMVLEDMILRLQINVAIATGFGELELPQKEGNAKKYIDLWPIQMSAEIAHPTDEKSQNVLTSNFDTYTLILQLGCILHTVPSWKRAYKVRVAVFVEYECDVEDEKTRVATLLDSLRIEAEVLVFWLAAGDIRSYEIVVNGADDKESDNVDKILEDEDWWTDLKRLRGKLASGEVSDVQDLDALSLADDTMWPPAHFQNGQRDPSTHRFEGLKKLMIKGNGRRSSYSNLSRLGVKVGMRTHRMDDDLISRHADASSTESTETEEDSIGSDSAVEGSEQDEDEESSLLSDTDNGEDPQSPSTASISRSKHSKKGSMVSSKHSEKLSKKRSLRHAAHVSASQQGSKNVSRVQSPDSTGALIDLDEPVPSSDTAPDADDERRGRPGVPEDAPEMSASTSHLDPRSLVLGDRSRSGSRSRFTSSPVPETRIATEEGVGPSIMFADDPRPQKRHESKEDVAAAESRSKSIYDRKLEPTSKSPPGARGNPSAASVPLSFNDLPCRAQHMILNELISQQSDDTAVIFTTLPAPTEDTYKSEVEALSYISDLEVLTDGLPPTLMIHSNSMTVTMNL